MPDRPGEAGPDVTKGRATRTSSSEPPAATGPKRPGSSSTGRTPGSGASPNGPDSPRARTRTRTRTSTAKPSSASEGRSADPSDRGRRTGGSKRREPSRSRGSAVPRRAATGAAAVGGVADPSTDPTTEITGLDDRTSPTSRSRRRRGSDPAPVVDPARAATELGPEPEPDGDRRTTRSRTTPAVRRGRRVKRVLRRIELWSVLKLAIVLYTCMYVAVLLTVVVLWGLAYSSGQIENIETFMGEVGLDNYRFYGDRMFKAVAAIGAVGVLAGTVLTVLWAALVNIISEITGGIRLVVIEEEPVRRGGS